MSNIALSAAQAATERNQRSGRNHLSDRNPSDAAHREANCKRIAP
jgi:hypothetical protein